MNLARLSGVLVLLAVLLALPVSGQQEAVQEAVNRINDRIMLKLQAGQTSEADLAQELNDLSDLQSRYRSHKALSAELLYQRAEIYEKIIKDRQMALILYEQVATEFPGTPAGYVAAETVAAIRESADDGPSRSRANANANTGSEPSAADRSSAGSSRRPSAAAANPANARSVGTPTVGSKFPDFTVQDLDELPVSPAEYRGKFVLVDFWATSCEECVNDMGRKMLVYRKYHDRGFEIIGINRDRASAPMINFIRQRTITWRQHFDRDGLLSRRYNVTSVPASFLLDREGKVIAVNVDAVALDRTLDRHFSYGF